MSYVDAETDEPVMAPTRDECLVSQYSADILAVHLRLHGALRGDVASEEIEKAGARDGGLSTRYSQKMESYEAFAPFYDAVQGDAAEHASYLRSLIEKHQPKAKTVLELACGTGSILKQLQPGYEVSGVDLSAGMLAVAAQKVPEARLFHEDMTRFNLGETFDVVLCVFDSINHLLGFEQWEAVFDRAREHLREGGIFVFDINTERTLATLIEEPSWTQWFGDGNLLVMEVTDGGDGVGVWSIRVFEHLGACDYRLYSEDIREISFPADRIRASLRERYRRVSVYDARRSRPTPRSERLHFLCRK